MPSSRVKEALAVMQRHDAQLARAGETLEFAYYCSVFDKPYIQRFRRSASGMWVFDENLPAVYGSERGGGRREAQDVDTEDMDYDGSYCPFCGDGDSIICGACKFMICGGKSEEDHFFCRKSCGGSFRTKPATSVSGSLKKKNQVFCKMPTGPRQDAGMQRPSSVFGYLGSGNGRR